ncbi:bifunctional 5,10-methylenetetrahydrofolate dehydrogenase/5,10-methenyltetrahydrofolate cyclohydrolase [Planctopirus hydrillae]|uniref:Bifunctional protein FolD n=1 Tax=Planctopirus hydrillae TaxID=1841610 RepID=A0A1C3EUA5_9PLAN|nr:bifunctional 5,10-methylenetetrahydrofolate dehydrogenase/5,10-methenyltetrahydrofolate cyclohydrolase [Planctopirus hydrillae]ODA36852.1 bifunctional 5,10-methylene-tetrahydrofolate dehydrogenase/5,10-methylene-tetrahydrofolate cyclohydrolase [Planctopirus hydrillae]
MPARIIDGKLIAQQSREALALQVAEFTTATGVTPRLAAVLVGDDPASQVYVSSKQKACASVGMASDLFRLHTTTTQAELLELVDRLNHDPSIHGILVQLPLPSHIDPEAVLDATHPMKDVDCFHAENVGLLIQGRPRYLPCTPHGVQVLLEASGVSTDGAHVVVLGRSDIVGKPLANLLALKGPGGNATVTLCHSRTRNIASFTRQADILVAAIGQPLFVKADMVREGAVVIDVGTNRLDGKLVGDVAFHEVSEKAAAITPVPGGVGPMTIAMLLKNTLTAARLQTKSIAR